MIIADLHIHSRFSRACSKDITIQNLEKYAKLKGLDLLGTGDFQHPEWNKEIKKELSEDGTGILRTKTGFPFMLQTEISLVYTKANKGRRVHFIVLCPDIETSNQFVQELLKKGRIDYDGRPIFSWTTPEFLEIVNSINPMMEVIPAHAWTPWFGIFGSKSGFDSIEECAEEKARHIHAIETGLSSDPEMNWRVSKLDNTALVSFSDIHSHYPWRLGREATVFETTLDYKSIINAIRDKKILFTIETDPAYGKYHFDGHRACKISFSPAESKKHNGICPVCRRELNIGVQHRVEELADRPEGFILKNAPRFVRLIPLSELISAVYGTPVNSRATWKKYYDIINACGNEFNALMNADEDSLAKACGEELAKVIIQSRKGEIKIKPGYDGEYGVLQIKSLAREDDTPKMRKYQRGLDEFC